MSLITGFYERYDEENRLIINNARKIAYITKRMKSVCNKVVNILYFSCELIHSCKKIKYYQIV